MEKITGQKKNNTSCLKQPVKNNSTSLVDIGVHFVKGTFALEGDEALALTCFDRISTMHNIISQPSYLSKHTGYYKNSIF